MRSSPVRTIGAAAAGVTLQLLALPAVPAGATRR